MSGRGKGGKGLGKGGPSVTARFFVTTSKVSLISINVLVTHFQPRYRKARYSSSCPSWWCRACFYRARQAENCHISWCCLRTETIRVYALRVSLSCSVCDPLLTPFIQFRCMICYVIAVSVYAIVIHQFLSPFLPFRITPQFRRIVHSCVPPHFTCNISISFSSSRVVPKIQYICALSTHSNEVNLSLFHFFYGGVPCFDSTHVANSEPLGNPFKRDIQPIQMPLVSPFQRCTQFLPIC
jgi:hypothetical protein